MMRLWSEECGGMISQLCSCSDLSPWPLKPMTHDWFGKLLRRSNISVEMSWRARADFRKLQDSFHVRLQHQSNLGDAQNLFVFLKTVNAAWAERLSVHCRASIGETCACCESLHAILLNNEWIRSVSFIVLKDLLKLRFSCCCFFLHKAYTWCTQTAAPLEFTFSQSHSLAVSLPPCHYLSSFHTQSACDCNAHLLCKCKATPSYTPEGGQVLRHVRIVEVSVLSTE